MFGSLRIDVQRPTFHFRFEPEKFNTKSFIRYLEQILAYYRPRGEKVFMVLDNVGYHRAAIPWAAERSSEIELHFLPSYSPELNPAEQVWRRTKRLATHNRHFKSREQLQDAVSRRFNRYQGNPRSLRGIVARWA